MIIGEFVFQSDSEFVRVRVSSCEFVTVRVLVGPISFQYFAFDFKTFFYAFPDKKPNSEDADQNEADTSAMDDTVNNEESTNEQCK